MTESSRRSSLFGCRISTPFVVRPSTSPFALVHFRDFCWKYRVYFQESDSSKLTLIEILWCESKPAAYRHALFEFSRSIRIRHANLLIVEVRSPFSRSSSCGRDGTAASARTHSIDEPRLKNLQFSGRNIHVSITVKSICSSEARPIWRRKGVQSRLEILEVYLEHVLGSVCCKLNNHRLVLIVVERDCVAGLVLD